MTYLALILPVVLGFGLVQLTKPNKKHLQIFLSFSGAYLLSVTVLHLIPEVFESHTEHIGVYILIGIVLQSGLEYLSKGAEHGHIHHHNSNEQIPWLLLSSLCLHAFLEGMPLGLEQDFNYLMAIVIHKLPVAIILTIFLKGTSQSNSMVIGILLLFALMSPLGNFVAQHFPYIHQFENEINAVIIGVLLHISTAILFESSENHKFNLKKFIAILIGFSVAFISL